MSGSAGGDPGHNDIESVPFAFCVDQKPDDIWIDKVKISKVYTQAQSTFREDKQGPQHQKEIEIDKDWPRLGTGVLTLSLDSQARSPR